MKLNLCSVLTLFGIVLVSATSTLAQSSTSPDVVDLNLNHKNSWAGAQLIGSAKRGKLIVVTTDKPDRRQSCRVQLFTADKLVCSRAFGGSRTYTPEQIAALILPGDAGSKIPVVIGLNVGLGAAIWGTVVLTATCPACAVGTGIAAFLLFVVAGGILAADDQPDTLLYLAPGQHLSRKLGYIHD
jgi:hypothetical protein